MKEEKGKGVYVKDLEKVICKNFGECDKILTKGGVNRSVGFTLMNAGSSRSHSIFTIFIESSQDDLADPKKKKIKMGKLNLVDLAGSERQGKTGATGDRLKEATKINMSLSALGNVIQALTDPKAGHIPYRDSKVLGILLLVAFIAARHTSERGRERN